MSPQHLVVVGASLAGLRAVEAARKAGFTGRVSLVGAEEHLPYDRPPLSKAFLTGPLDDPWLRSEQELRAEFAVELVLGAPAVALDTTSRTVHTADRDIGYDALVIATGASPRTLPGTERTPGVHALRTLDDARVIRDHLDRGARTVVVGAGFIGSEIASSARARGVSTTVVEAAPTPLARAVGEPMGAVITALHRRHGTQVRCGTGVQAVHGDDRVTAVELTDGTVLAADLVVVGIGVTPNTGWLAGSGLELDDGIVCDHTLSTGVPGVWAAGDVVTWPNDDLGVRQRLENWTAAAEQGAAAGRNAVDPPAARPYATVPYFWSDWYGVRIQFVGTAQADHVEVVDGDPDTDGRWVALYRREDRLVGALTVQGQAEIMKYRALVKKRATWQQALDHAAVRRARTGAHA